MKYSLPTDLRFRRVLDEGVLILQEAREVLALNLVGVRILELVRDGLDTPEIIDRLASEFDVGADVLAGDVGTFLAELAAVGVLQAEPAP